MFWYQAGNELIHYSMGVKDTHAVEAGRYGLLFFINDIRNMYGSVGLYPRLPSGVKIRLGMGPMLGDRFNRDVFYYGLLHLIIHFVQSFDWPPTQAHYKADVVS